MIERKGKYKFNENLRRFKKFERNVPPKVAATAKKHFVHGFRQGAMRGGGFTDASRGGWKPRKRETRLSRRKGILIKQGFLWKSIHIARQIWERIEIRTKGLNYPIVHNEGRRSGRGTGFMMPKRELMGDSQVLFNKIKVILRTEMKKVLS